MITHAIKSQEIFSQWPSEKQVPLNIIEKVISYIDDQDQLNLKQVNKSWNQSVKKLGEQNFLTMRQTIGWIVQNAPNYKESVVTLLPKIEKAEKINSEEKWDEIAYDLHTVIIKIDLVTLKLLVKSDSLKEDRFSKLIRKGYQCKEQLTEFITAKKTNLHLTEMETAQKIQQKRLAKCLSEAKNKLQQNLSQNMSDEKKLMLAMTLAQQKGNKKVVKKASNKPAVSKKGRPSTHKEKKSTTLRGIINGWK